MLPRFAEWRFPALLGLVIGLAASPFLPIHPSSSIWLSLLAGSGALVALRPPTEEWAGKWPWLALVGIAAALAGGATGSARLSSIDSGALPGSVGKRSDLRGFVTAVPRRTDGKVRIDVQSGHGKLLVEAPEPVRDLPVGAEVSVSGELARPPPWFEATLRRRGIATILRAQTVVATGERRGGFAGRLDSVRQRAVDALGRGMPEREAALARGFALGQDDSIDSRTIEDFRRSGLAHLLAVSGQNVLLLALLAAPLLALLGIPLRARLLFLLGIIAIYVPLAGGGASIQRAGVMGGAALVATMASRPASKLFAVLAAAAITLALNPRASGDPGWQLSFAAVIGILVLARPLAGLMAGRFGGGAVAALITEGAGVTIAATLATAPLIAGQFGTFSVSSLIANLLALPAVAPSMWLGMTVGVLAQIPHFPVEPLNGLNSLLLAYIAQIATWLGRPAWASLELPDLGIAPILASYAALALVAAVILRWSARNRVLGLPAGSRVVPAEPGVGRPSAVGLVNGGEVPDPRPRPRPRRLRTFSTLACVSLLIVLIGIPLLLGSDSARSRTGLRITVMDVGQGDAILLQPRSADPVLVDAGPIDGEIVEGLTGADVTKLAALVITHDEADHSGGASAVFGEMPVERLVYGFASRRLLRSAGGSGSSVLRVAEGSEFRSGGLRLSVLWPPRVLLDAPVGDDRNARSLVLLARWRGFSMLLTGDAEAEVVPVDPGRVDVLKVAHHGSDDAGLERLLDGSVPGLAVISVGEDNTYGHPTPATLATLEDRQIPVMRTDDSGSIVIDVGAGGFTAAGAG